MFNFIVTFTPDGFSTVDKMVVVDAWSSTSRSLPQARTAMLRAFIDDVGGNYSKHGAGHFTVARQGGSQYV